LNFERTHLTGGIWLGHNLLGVLPRTKRWVDVVEYLDNGASTADVVGASMRAAERQFLQASDDPVFVEAVRVLLNVPLAGRADNFGQALRDTNIPVQGEPELLDLLAAMTSRLDEVRSEAPNVSDMGDLAGRALIATFSRAIGDARQLSWSRGVSELSRQFFSELMSGTLSYWLDRTLATHVGSGLRFADAAERGSFDVELRDYTSSMTRIIQEFSGGWYGKTLHNKGGFGSRDAAIFGAVALKKIVSELRRDQVLDA
jgi:hypothetical protein